MNTTIKTCKTTDVQYLLDVRAVAYATFHRVFGEEPSEELRDFVSLPEVRQTLEVVMEGYDDFKSDMNELLAHTSLEKLKDEYTRLFIGPNKLPAPPWESVYTNEGNLLFQKSTLKIRQTYLDEGLLPAEYPHVADDHLAIELDFMLRLIQKLSTEDLEVMAALSNLQTEERFLQEHLLTWVPLFEKAMVEKGESHFYAAAARLLNRFIQEDFSMTRELIDVVKTTASRQIS